MGKHKTGIYDQERNNRIADNLESYIDAIENLLIVEGKNVERIKKSEKIVRKAIKDLRNGKPEKVFDIDRFEEFERQGKTRFSLENNLSIRYLGQ